MVLLILVLLINSDTAFQNFLKLTAKLDSSNFKLSIPTSLSSPKRIALFLKNKSQIHLLQTTSLSYLTNHIDDIQTLTINYLNAKDLDMNPIKIKNESFDYSDASTL